MRCAQTPESGPVTRSDTVEDDTASSTLLGAGDLEARAT